MIINFFKKQFNRNNIENRKTRVYLPSLFIGYIITLFIISFFLNTIFSLENGKTISEEDNGINIYSTILFLIFGAIMEEFKYRGMLTKFSYRWTLISFSIFITSISFLICNVRAYYLSPESVLPLISYILSFVIISVLIFYVSFYSFRRFKENIHRIFDNNFYLIIWIQVLLFALWHILFSGQSNHKHWFTLLIVHSYSALFFTYIRVNYGILYSIILHFLHNIIRISPIILLEFLS